MEKLKLLCLPPLLNHVLRRFVFCVVLFATQERSYFMEVTEVGKTSLQLRVS